MRNLASISIQDLKDGEPKAQRLLYDTCKGKLFALSARYTNTTQDAEDVFIQGFTRILNRIHEFDGRNLEAWMKRIIVNEAINHFHKHKSQTGSHFTEPTGNLANDDFNALDQLEMEDLLRLISEIPEGCRIIFNLYAIEGYQHKEIAAMLNVSESTSKSQYIRAKQLLQSKLKTTTTWKKEAI